MKENWLIISTFPTTETESDVKLVKGIFLVATEATENIILVLLKKYSFCKAMRITALMQNKTFYNQGPITKPITGSITTKEKQQQKLLFMKWTQEKFLVQEFWNIGQALTFN